MAVAREMVERTSPLFVTPAEYLDREVDAFEKSEYIAGEILALSGGTPVHAYISSDTQYALMAAFHAARSGCDANNSDLKVRIADDGPFFYPDVSVTCGEPEIDADDCLRNPVLIVEVLSASTAGFDRGEKFRYYRQIASLRHYVIVEQNICLVEHFVRHETALWTLGGKYSALEDVLHLDDLGIEISLASIYRRAPAIRTGAD